jgi:hypothetical protein
VQGYGTATYWSAILAHVVGAAAGGAVTGITLAAAGSTLLTNPWPSWGPDLLAILGLLIVLRELTFRRFPIPQLRRQTSKRWRHRLGPVPAALAWGVDLGTGITTFVRYPGFWILPVAASVSGSPAFGGLVLGLFGVARATTVAVATLFIREPGNGSHALREQVLWIAAQEQVFRRLHGPAIFIVSLGLFVLSGL